jgi:hypothetical protein
MNADYKAALLAHSAAFATYRVVRDAYQARTVGDAEYLAARAKYDAATKAFDLAYEAVEAAE